MSLALVMPVKQTIQNNMNALTAAPVMNVKNAPSTLVTPTIGTRFMRSASHPSGIAPSAKNRPDAVLMNTTVPLLMWNVWISSGSIVCTAPRVSWSNETSRPRTMNMSLPPRENASLKSTGSDSTPGSMSSGKMTCSLARAWASCRAASSSSTAAASVAAFPIPPGASLGSSTAPPAAVIVPSGIVGAP